MQHVVFSIPRHWNYPSAVRPDIFLSLLAKTFSVWQGIGFLTQIVLIGKTNVHLYRGNGLMVIIVTTSTNILF